MLALMHLSGSGKNVSARAKHSRDIFPNDFDAISLFPQLHQMSASSWKKKGMESAELLNVRFAQQN